jgi:predicted enzyme related to lactoylglutathione lyase
MDLLINVDVNDLDQAIAFYSAAFGLRVSRRFGSGGVEMQGAAAPFYLLVKASGSRAAKSIEQIRDYRRHWTPVHLDFVVPDLAAAVSRAEGAGATLEGAPETHNWGRIAHLADPFGHGFCLLQFLGRGYDEIATPA